MYNVNEGSLIFMYTAKWNTITACIQKSQPSVNECEAVSQDQLSALFGDDHDYVEEDAATIIEWMNSQP